MSISKRPQKIKIFGSKKNVWINKKHIEIIFPEHQKDLVIEKVLKNIISVNKFNLRTAEEIDTLGHIEVQIFSSLLKTEADIIKFFS